MKEHSEPSKEETKLQSEQKTLQQCKDQVAHNHSFTDWKHLLKAHSGMLDHYITMVAELYAAQFKSQKDMKAAFEAGLHEGMGDTTFDQWLATRKGSTETR